ncbi:MAG: hypothetical protein U0441_20250 [Polyangiaceae bacterium]
MKRHAIIPVILSSILGACTHTDGQCWLRSEDSGGSGVGGGVVGPPVGGFGDDIAPTPQNTAGGVPPDCQSNITGFSASLFKFATTVADDGEGKAGGYQEASTTLVFIDGRQDPTETWTCNVWMKMPLRTEKLGTISATKAAEIASDVTTFSSSAVMHSRPSWQPTLFCGKFQDMMNEVFKNSYPGLGAQATAKR